MATGRGRAVLAAAGLFALAFAVRALPWRRVFLPEGVQFPGNDPYYHARRVLYSSAHFPEVLERDAYLNFPHGGEPIWSPALDIAAAGLLRLFPGDLAAELVDPVLAWIPPVIGALTVLATAFLGSRVFGPRSGLWAGVGLALLPAHQQYSQVGFFDHHVAVALASVALLAATMDLLGCLERGAPRRRRGLSVSGLGVSIAACLIVWPGMLLHVGLVELGLLVFLGSRTDSAAYRTGAWAFCAAHGLAFVLIAPFALGHEWRVWGSFTPVVLSSFQPWLLGAGGLCFGAVALAPLGTSRAPRPLRRWLPMAIAGSVVLILSSGALPGAVVDIWQWFAKTESFQAEVSESRALLSARDGFDPMPAMRLLSGLFFLLPFALVSGWTRFRRAGIAAPGLFLVAWSAGLLAAALVQTRFANSLAIVLALWMAWWIPHMVSRRLSRSSHSGLAQVAAVFGVAALAAPALSRHASGASDQVRAWSGEPPITGSFHARRRILADTARWIRENTPETSGFTDASQAPEYAVLSSWPDGHVLTYVGRRPAVVTPFGDDVGDENMTAAARYYAAPEAEANDLLERFGARYAVFEYRKVQALRDLDPFSTTVRLYFHDGEAVDRTFVVRAGEVRGARVSVPAMERHRLVYESPPKPYGGATRPAFKVYEHVAGARIEGRARPHAEVTLSLDLLTNQGREIVWSARTVADAGGRWTQRVPYASRGGPPATSSQRHYRIESRGRLETLAVDEADVLEGRRVEAPNLEGGEAAAR